MSTLRMVHAKRWLNAGAVKKRSSLAKCMRVKYPGGIVIAKGVAKDWEETSPGTDYATGHRFEFLCNWVSVWFIAYFSCFHSLLLTSPIET